MRATTAALYAIFCLGGFELFAVTTVMPVISRELDGAALYAFATSAALAGSIVGMIVAGQLSDRVRAAAPAVGAIALSIVGTVLLALAPSMEVFVVGRLLQGVGSGGAVSAAYVIAARVYPGALLPRAFGMFSSAFLLPALFGPSVSAAVTAVTSWRWMFAGLAVLLPVVIVLLLPSLRTPPSSTRSTGGSSGRRVGAAVGIAAAAIALNVAGTLPAPWGAVVFVAGLAVVVVGVLLLMPPGVRPFARGLGTLLVIRGAYNAGLTTAELFIPLLFAAAFGAPPWAAALVLSAGALTWIGTSTLQARASRLSSVAIVRLGAASALLGFGVILLGAALGAPPWLIALGWVFCTGAGGLIFPRNSALLIEASAEQERGANSSSMLVIDSSFTATTTAVAGLVFAGLTAAGAAGPVAEFLRPEAAVFAVCVLTAALTVVLALRLGPGRDRFRP